MADSQVDVFNLALSLLGGHQLLSVNAPWEQSTIGALCNTNFPEVLRKNLEAHNWSFATKSQYLARSPEAGRDGYQYRYVLPTDCLRPIRFDGHGPFDGPHFIRESEEILTNIMPARLIYIAYLNEPKKWPPSFTTALAWGLAAIVAMANNNDGDKQQQCLKNSMVLLEEAWSIDLQTQNPRLKPSRWALGRRGGYRSER